MGRSHSLAGTGWDALLQVVVGSLRVDEIAQGGDIAQESSGQQILHPLTLEDHCPRGQRLKGFIFTNIIALSMSNPSPSTCNEYPTPTQESEASYHEVCRAGHLSAGSPLLQAPSSVSFTVGKRGLHQELVTNVRISVYAGRVASVLIGWHMAWPVRLKHYLKKKLIYFNWRLITL